MRQQFSRYNSRKARERRFGGGGGGEYTASAVHFDATDQLAHAGALSGVSDAETGIFSIWRKAAADQIMLLTSSANGSFNIPNNGSVGLYAQDEPGDNYADVTAPATISDGSWHHLLISWHAGASVGARTFHIYVDDVAKTPDDSGDGDGVSIHYTDEGWEFLNGTNIPGGGVACDVADAYFAPGQYLDFSVEANRRKFISATGKPVDLGADGSTPTGVAPAIFFSGDATSFNTNKGTGGVFTLTGELTNASTSPSD